jgi:hypothetical protein
LRKCLNDCLRKCLNDHLEPSRLDTPQPLIPFCTSDMFARPSRRRRSIYRSLSHPCRVVVVVIVTIAAAWALPTDKAWPCSARLLSAHLYVRAIMLGFYAGVTAAAYIPLPRQGRKPKNVWLDLPPCLYIGQACHFFIIACLTFV